MDRITKQIRVYGIVQGVGFRPTVSRHAAASGITGSVCNRGPFVEIFARGSEREVEDFEVLLREKPPVRAAILKIDSRQVESKEEYSEFQIIESAKTSGEIFISPDIATCDACREELRNPKDRRYRHPFINCTCCGPRLTILDALPYDRERTSMKEFPMCPECHDEYYSPATRRYDAQPVCCNDCGPRVYILPQEGAAAPAISNQELDQGGILQNAAAIREARRVIAEGGIAAIKGIGGYHLCCDATSEKAVRLLRTRKTRPMKPLAVMMRDMEAVDRECRYTEEQKVILTGHQKPILLLEKKEGGLLAPSIAPDNPKVGVMLPYAPVQMLLFDSGEEDGITMPDCLVMTSGNVSGAPICRDDLDAAQELGNLCDTILSHNRKIRIRADDSVMDFYRDKPYMIRRSRGYAPLPYLSGQEMKGCVLAIGGELKNTFCIGVNGLFYPSPYVGDLEDLRTVEALKETISRFQTLLEVTPERVICDLHPRYNSTMVAEELGLPLQKIQHHYAHILSCMAENDAVGQVIGLSLDGTGYGEDGTIWGGEILLADEHGFTREGHIAPFLQIGGDSSSKEGWRIAVSMIYGLTGDKEKTGEIVKTLSLSEETGLKMQLVMADRKINSIQSTSAGRLFDGVSAILGIRKASTFEGEASTALQFAAENWKKRLKNGEEKEEISFPCGWQQREEEEILVLSTDHLVRELLERRLSGEDPEYLAWLFHKGLAELLIAACLRIREKRGINRAALSGGCFQNLLLLELVQTGLEREGFEVLIHSLIPPNDGGIGLGQAYYGLLND